MVTLSDQMWSRLVLVRAKALCWAARGTNLARPDFATEPVRGRIPSVNPYHTIIWLSGGEDHQQEGSHFPSISLLMAKLSWQLHTGTGTFVRYLPSSQHTSACRTSML